MKKFITVLFAVMLALGAFSLVACGNENPPSNPSEPSNPDTEKTYTVTYEFGDMEGKAEITIARKSFAVKSGEEFVLDIPTPKDKFDYWVIKGTDEEFKSGVFTLDRDVTLVAVWMVNTPEY